jgi:hypothetical protein
LLGEVSDRSPNSRLGQETFGEQDKVARPAANPAFTLLGEVSDRSPNSRLGQETCGEQDRVATPAANEIKRTRLTLLQNIISPALRTDFK